MRQCVRESHGLRSLGRRHVIARPLAWSCRQLQQEASPRNDLPRNGQKADDNVTFVRQAFKDPPVNKPYPPARNDFFRKTQIPERSPEPLPDNVSLLVDSEPRSFSPTLLRDLCECTSCLDPSTKQKSFSTADIPYNIRPQSVAQTSEGATISWVNDIRGFDQDHTTDISLQVLRNLAEYGFANPSYSLEPQTLWDAEAFSRVPDIDYKAYMQDESVLYQALRQLQTHGLLFISNVPDSAKSVSTLGERIGPIKNTFYGYTWDVRSVPEAKNVAYTSQDLGFHMDLLYMHQPPHLQLLHCIRSSAKGGASLFSDSYRAAQELFATDFERFATLAGTSATFHYDHPTSHLYQQQRNVFELRPLSVGSLNFTSIRQLVRALDSAGNGKLPQSDRPFSIVDYLDAVSWSPPFQGPFSLRQQPSDDKTIRRQPLLPLNRKVDHWTAAARKFSALIHRTDRIYERLMRPGECVIFDNRRVLHARKAFEVGDAGTERWLRGAYLDKDPYISKLRVLEKQFGQAVSGIEE